MAATGGPGGPCQPHTVKQLTTEKEKGRVRAGGVEGRQRRSENRKELEEK